jgi:flotillin
MPEVLTNPILIAVVAIIVALLLVFYAVAKLIVKVPPDELAVFTGSGKSGGQGADPTNVTYVRGGRKIRIPLLHQVDRMSLKPMSVPVQLTDVLASGNVEVSIDGVAMIGYGMDEEAAVTAATNFLHYTPQEVHAAVKEVLIGQIRGVVANMTPEQLNEDRAELQAALTTAADAEYQQFGMRVMSFQIQQISDNAGLFAALGQKRVADAKADAERDVAQAKLLSRRAVADADREAQQAEQAARAQVAEATRDADVRVAEAKAATDAKDAEAAQAGPLADARARKDVLIAEEEARAAQEEAALQVEQRRTERSRQAQQADTIVPAEAAREAATLQAEANRVTTVTAAEAEAAATRNKGAAEAEARTAAAGATKEELLAAAGGKKADLEATATGEAALLLARAEGEGAMLKARAEGEQGLAEAFNAYTPGATQLALLPRLIEALPSIAGKIAEPFGNIDRVVLIGGNEGNGEGDGSQSLLGQIATTVPMTMALMREVVQSTTGLDITSIFSGDDTTTDSSPSPTKAALVEQTGTTDGQPEPQPAD